MSIEKIEALVKEAHLALNEDKNPIIDNYPQLKDAVIQRDLLTELTRLEHLFKTSDSTPEKSIKEQFLTLWRAHTAQHQDTALALAFYPEGVCNQLYWNIAVLLFNPQSLADMLAILYPHQMSVLGVDYDGRKITLNKTPLEQTALKQDAFDISLMRHLVIMNDYIFDTREIENYELKNHIALSLALEHYPDLEKKLYSSSMKLIFLQTLLKSRTEQGVCMRELIEQLRSQLIRYGETFTKQKFASTNADQAIDYFLILLGSLSSIEKEKFLKLSSHGKMYSLQTILQALRDGECIETYAEHLEKILKNSDNKAELNKKLSFINTDTIVEKLKALTDPSQGMRENAQHLLSQTLTVSLLKNIKVDRTEMLVDLLLGFPTEQYPLLLAQIQLSPTVEFLKDLAKNYSILSDSMLSAFSDAIISLPDQFPLHKTILFFAKLGDTQRLELAITALCQRPDFVSSFSKFTREYHGLLVHITENPDAFDILLAHFSKAIDQQKILDLLITRCEPLLHNPLSYANSTRRDAAPLFPKIVSMILKYYPFEAVLEALKKKCIYSANTSVKPKIKEATKNTLVALNNESFDWLVCQMANYLSAEAFINELNEVAKLFKSTPEGKERLGKFSFALDTQLAIHQKIFSTPHCLNTVFLEKAIKVIEPFSGLNTSAFRKTALQTYANAASAKENPPAGRLLTRKWSDIKVEAATKIMEKERLNPAQNMVVRLTPALSLISQAPQPDRQSPIIKNVSNARKSGRITLL